MRIQGLLNSFFPGVNAQKSFGGQPLSAGYSGLLKQVYKGLQQTAKDLTSVKTQKDMIGISSSFSQQTHQSFKIDSSIATRKVGNTAFSAQQYALTGKQTTQSNLVNQSLTTQSTANKGIQITSIFEQKATLTNIGTQLNKTINTELGIKTYGNAQKMVKEYDLKTQTEQDTERLTQSNTASDVTKDVTLLDKKGTVVGETFSRTVGEVDTATNWAQQVSGEEEKKGSEVTSVDRQKVGNATVTYTQIQAESERQGQTNSATQAETNTQSSSTVYDKNGAVVAERSAFQQTVSQSGQQVNLEEKNASERGIMTIQEGQSSVTIDKSKSVSELSQTTVSEGSSVVNRLDANGNIISSKTTQSESESELNRKIETENARVISRSPDAVSGFGSYQENVSTQISNNSQVIGGAAAESQRQIESSKTIDWEGSIQIGQAQQGAKTYSISNVELTSAVTQDVTKSGQTQQAVTTETEIGKTVKGTVEAKLDQVKPVNAPGTTIAVNFGTYTGLGTGFKMDNGEVNFSLSFSSAELTQQSAVKETGDKVVSSSKTESGQINDASLVGKLRSYTTEDGRQVIEVSASYVKDGAKYVNGQPGAAIAGADTNVEIKGSMIIDKTGQTKSIQSDFEMFKTEDIQAEGTSAAAVKQAVDISDPLRKSFTFDKGIFSFQLGFASMNIAVYA